MTLFHLYAAYDIVPTQPLRYTHVAFVMVLCVPAVSGRGAVSQPHPVVRRAGGGGCGRDSRSTRIWGGEDFTDRATMPDAARRHARRDLHRAAAGGDAAHHRADHADRRASVHRLRDARAVSAAAVDASRLRPLPAGRPSVHHAGRDLRRRGRCLVDADHHVHDLRRVPAALRRRQVLHRFLDGADGRQAEQRRAHGRAVLVPARRSVGFGRCHDGDHRRRRLSDDGAGRLREERRRRIAGSRRARRNPVAARARRRRVPDRGVPQDQLPRRDLDGDHPDLALLPVASVHGRTRRQAVRRRARCPTTSR